MIVLEMGTAGESKLFLPVNPEHYRCPCGNGRKFIFSSNGHLCLRCPKCEPEDDYSRFLRTLGDRVKHILRRDRTTLKSIEIDPPEYFSNERCRFVRLWVEEWETPLTWFHPFPAKNK
jgi:hypothetical protein